MGPNFIESGFELGKRKIEEAGIGEGDLAFTPVEGNHAVGRHEGVEKALDEVEARPRYSAPAPPTGRRSIC